MDALVDSDGIIELDYCTKRSIEFNLQIDTATNEFVFRVNHPRRHGYVYRGIADYSVPNVLKLHYNTVFNNSDKSTETPDAVVSYTYTIKKEATRNTYNISEYTVTFNDVLGLPNDFGTGEFVLYGGLRELDDYKE